MKSSFNFNDSFVEINNKTININIKNYEKYEKFVNTFLETIKNKYKNYNFRINKLNDFIVYNKNKYKIYNDKNLKLGSSVETIGRISNVEVIQKNNNFYYDITIENITDATCLKIFSISKEKIDIFKINNYILFKGRVDEIPKKDYEKQLNFNKYVIKNPTVSLVDKKEIINIVNIGNKRRPLCLHSSLSDGFINSISLLKRNDIQNYCVSDLNTLNFVANKDDTPLSVRGYIEINKKYYSVYLFLNCQDSEIEFNGEKVKVNEGIRFINECISKGERHNGATVFNVLDLMENKDKVKIGSMDHEGLVYQALLDDNFVLLSEYLEMFDIMAIEPMSSLEVLCREGRKNSSISSLKTLNNTIKNLCIKQSIPLVFNDNAMVVNKDDREYAKEFLISNKIREENIKNRDKFIEEQKRKISLNEIGYIRTVPEITDELFEQGFTTLEMEHMIFDELIFHGMLPKKSEVTIIPDYLFVEDNKEEKEKLKNIVKNEIDYYHDRELIKKELSMVFKRNYQKVFLAAYTVSRLSRQLGYPVGERGTAGCMYLCYLLKISNIDPKEFNLDTRMFLGPNMEKVPDIDINVSSDIVKQVIEDFNKYFPRTMKASICSYFKENSIKSQILAKTNPQNLDIYYACNILSGKLARIQPHNSGIMLLPSIDVNYIFPTIKYNDELIPGYPYEYLDKVIPKVDILSKTDLNILKDIDSYVCLEHYNQKETFDNKSEEIYRLINRNSENISELNTDYARKIIELIKPKNFDDLIVIQGLLHGRGVLNSAEICAKNGKRIISSREDLVELLEKYTENAFDIMEKIRKGNYEKLTDEELKDIEKLPEEYQYAVIHIQYLFPKSHAIAYARQSYFSAYYELNKDEILKRRNIKADNDMSFDDMEEFFEEE